MVHGFKDLFTKNVNDLLDLNGHINTKLGFKPKDLTCENTSSLEPVLFESCITLYCHIQCLGLLTSST